MILKEREREKERVDEKNKNIYSFIDKLIVIMEAWWWCSWKENINKEIVIIVAKI